MAVPFYNGVDKYGQALFAPMLSDTTYSFTCSSTVVTLPIPAGFRWAYISGSGNYYVASGHDPVIPTSTIPVLQPGSLNKAAVNIHINDSQPVAPTDLRFVASTTVQITVEFYT